MIQRARRSSQSFVASRSRATYASPGQGTIHSAGRCPVVGCIVQRWILGLRGQGHALAVPSVLSREGLSGLVVHRDDTGAVLTSPLEARAGPSPAPTSSLRASRSPLSR